VYYAKVVKSAFMDSVPETVPAVEIGGRPVGPSLRFAMVLTVVGTIAIGINPSWIADLATLTKDFASGF